MVYHQKYVNGGYKLLSLHISKIGLFSAVWVKEESFDIGKEILIEYGIKPPEKKSIQE